MIINNLLTCSLFLTTSFLIISQSPKVCRNITQWSNINQLWEFWEEVTKVKLKRKLFRLVIRGKYHHCVLKSNSNCSRLGWTSHPKQFPIIKLYSYYCLETTTHLNVTSRQFTTAFGKHKETLNAFSFYFLVRQ